jgi:hypothetical protein
VFAYGSGTSKSVDQTDMTPQTTVCLVTTVRYLLRCKRNAAGEGLSILDSGSTG